MIDTRSRSTGRRGPAADRRQALLTPEAQPRNNVAHPFRQRDDTAATDREGRARSHQPEKGRRQECASSAANEKRDRLAARKPPSNRKGSARRSPSLPRTPAAGGHSVLRTAGRLGPADTPSPKGEGNPVSLRQNPQRRLKTTLLGMKEARGPHVSAARYRMDRVAGHRPCNAAVRPLRRAEGKEKLVTGTRRSRDRSLLPRHPQKPVSLKGYTDRAEVYPHDIAVSDYVNRYIMCNARSAPERGTDGQ